MIPRSVGSVPPNTFRGTNFMTPAWLGYYRLADGCFAELSGGRGIYNEPIFGVTVRAAGKWDVNDPRSKMFHSEAAALAYIKEMS